MGDTSAAVNADPSYNERTYEVMYPGAWVVGGQFGQGLVQCYIEVSGSSFGLLVVRCRKNLIYLVLSVVAKVVLMTKLGPKSVISSFGAL